MRSTPPPAGAGTTRNSGGDDDSDGSGGPSGSAGSMWEGGAVRAGRVLAGAGGPRDAPAAAGFAALRVATAAALVVDAVVHLRDAAFYDANAGTLITQGQLFRAEAAAAILAAAAVLLWPRWPSWAFAALVAGSAAVAVVVFTYLDIGPFAGLPGMHEPSWALPGKLASAWAEGAGALLALAGLAWALALRRARPPAGRGLRG